MSLVADRLRAAIEAVVRALVPPVDSLALYECQVVAWHDADQSADLVPVAPATNLPPAMAHVPQRVGPPGTTVTLVVGSRVLVGFTDGDLAQPEIRFADLPGTSGFLASGTSVRLADGTHGAARVGDSVGGGTLAIAMPGGVPTFTYTPPGGGTPVVGTTVTLSGAITSGSTIVRIG